MRLSLDAFLAFVRSDCARSKRKIATDFFRDQAGACWSALSQRQDNSLLQRVEQSFVTTASSKNLTNAMLRKVPRTIWRWTAADAARPEDCHEARIAWADRRQATKA